MIGSYWSILIGSHKILSNKSFLSITCSTQKRYMELDHNHESSVPFSSSFFSDKMFEMIRYNRVKDLLHFFQHLPQEHLQDLVNEPNGKYKDMLPINYVIRCSASHLIYIMLLRLGARFDFPSTAAQPSPLFTAVRSGQMNLVKILIVSGADINRVDEKGYSILHWACFKRNTLMIRLILKMTNFTFHNNDRNEKRITPLGTKDFKF